MGRHQGIVTVAAPSSCSTAKLPPASPVGLSSRSMTVMCGDCWLLREPLRTRAPTRTLGASDNVIPRRVRIRMRFRSARRDASARRESQSDSKRNRTSPCQRIFGAASCAWAAPKVAAPAAVASRQATATRKHVATLRSFATGFAGGDRNGFSGPTAPRRRGSSDVARHDPQTGRVARVDALMASRCLMRGWG